MERGSGATRRTVLAGLALGVPLALSGCGPKGHASTSASVSGADTTIMIIRHGEKPGGGERGRDESGQRDKKSLTARGWQRAKALPGLFVAASGRPAPPLPRPATLFAAADTGPHAGAHRMRQTVAPLAEALHERVDVSIAEGQESALAAAALAAPAPVLICWEHSRIPDIVRALGAADSGAPQAWPERFDLVWVFTRRAGKWSFRAVAQGLLAGDA
ncbi:hypothetical protein [Streptomyces melanogenes]|uniref:hypothetical protein n=1 Tax=Streptomyces melanogenes TaxID=67326 RepID=UPI0019862DF8|nr:hypothetical protein [Streptomyces melanogenes]GGP45724.1 hypothetical protein GCM10010278_23120 [Streptomyces melanogenes]